MILRLLTAIFWGLTLSNAGAQIIDEVPRQTALTWLDLVDGEKYEESWKTAAPLFQKAVAKEDWVLKIKETRKTLGAILLRDFVRARFLKDPEGMPPGEYLALEFESQFALKKVRELVVPMKDPTGLWQVSLYSIGPVPDKPSE